MPARTHRPDRSGDLWEMPRSHGGIHRAKGPGWATRPIPPRCGRSAHSFASPYRPPDRPNRVHAFTFQILDQGHAGAFLLNHKRVIMGFIAPSLMQLDHLASEIGIF